MFRSKDLYNRSIYDSCGKEIGKIRDVVLDFINGKVSGFLISDNEKIKIKRIDMQELKDEDSGTFKWYEEKDLFSDIKSMRVVDRGGCRKGVVNDFILDEESFEIKAFILKNDNLNLECEENEVILCKDLILEDGFIQYFGEPNISFKNTN